VGVDSTTLEANAAMKSIIRRDTGEDWKQFLARLMREEGLIEASDEPTDEDLRRFDKKRKNKKVSNEEWVSKTDPDSRITKMKDSRTHLAYKAEHVVDLDTELIVAAEIYHADEADSQTLEDSLVEAQTNVRTSGSDAQIEEVAGDKGYHSGKTLADIEEHTPWRTYIPEPKLPHDRRWTDKPQEQKRAVYNNRRRVRRDKSKRLGRRRSEVVERTFAHVCETGGARRTWLRGIEKVKKRHLIATAAHNLGVLMRTLFGIGTARSLQGDGGLLSFLYTLYLVIRCPQAAPDRPRMIVPMTPQPAPIRRLNAEPICSTPHFAAFSTGC